MLADNKLALNAGWDEEILAEELKALLADDLDFDIGVTGFSIAEIDSLVEGLAPEEPGDPEDDVCPSDGAAALPAGRRLAARAASADLRQRARAGHRSPLLMDGERAQMVFTDPPYNVPIDGHVGGSGAIKHREFAMASGEMTTAEFTALPAHELPATWSRPASTARSTSSAWTGATWPRCSTAAEGVYSELKNLIVWVKDNGGMGTFYRSRHELIFAFKNGTAPHINSFELGQHGRYRTNVWQYRGVNTLKAGRMDELALHPTVKPVQMIADAIKDVSGRGDIVLDLFGGTGSTLIAAHKTGRRAYLCELDPIYCDRIIRRWEAYAKDEAEQIACGVERRRSAKG